MRFLSHWPIQSCDPNNLKMEDFQISDDSIQSENNSSGLKDSDNEEEKGNPQLADALAKAIRMGKSKNGKTVVLSKAKLYNTNSKSKKTHGFEIVPGPNGEIKVEEEIDIKPDIEEKKPKKDLKGLKITKQEKLKRGKLHPSPLDREKERPLVRIATRGVVQLFNAIRQQQLAINKQLNKPGITEGKKEKILKSIDKKAFLKVLMGKTRASYDSDSKIKESKLSENEMKSEAEEEPSWKVLRDDFMMGAKLKDWDKKEIEPMEE